MGTWGVVGAGSCRVGNIGAGLDVAGAGLDAVGTAGDVRPGVVSAGVLRGFGKGGRFLLAVGVVAAFAFA